MNDIKTSERSRLGQKNLKNLMLWHRLGRTCKVQDTPVIAILKEFRVMAFVKGSRPHRPWPQVTYEYQKNRISREETSTAASSSS